MARMSVPNLSKRANVLILGTLGGLLVCLLAVYFSLSPRKFELGDSYFWVADDPEMEETAILDLYGKPVVGPARIELWGYYPYVYGLTDQAPCARFILNLQDGSLHCFPADIGEYHEYDEFDRFIGQYGFPTNRYVTLRGLYPPDDAEESDDAKQRRAALKLQLSRKYKPLPSLFDFSLRPERR